MSDGRRERGIRMSSIARVCSNNSAADLDASCATTRPSRAAKAAIVRHNTQTHSPRSVPIMVSSPCCAIRTSHEKGDIEVKACDMPFSVRADAQSVYARWIQP